MGKKINDKNCCATNEIRKKSLLINPAARKRAMLFLIDLLKDDKSNKSNRLIDKYKKEIDVCDVIEDLNNEIIYLRTVISELSEAIEMEYNIDEVLLKHKNIIDECFAYTINNNKYIADE